jgi:hypothetical protein
MEIGVGIESEIALGIQSSRGHTLLSPLEAIHSYLL